MYASERDEIQLAYDIDGRIEPTTPAFSVRK